jgi:hypothetical protein
VIRIVVDRASNLEVPQEAIDTMSYGAHFYTIYLGTAPTCVSASNLANLPNNVDKKVPVNKVRQRTDDNYGSDIYNVQKRQGQNSNMRPGHVLDKKTIDALEKKYNWNKDKRQEFHRYIDSLKERGETLSWKELDDLARDF